MFFFLNIIHIKFPNSAIYHYYNQYHQMALVMYHPFFHWFFYFLPTFPFLVTGNLVPISCSYYVRGRVHHGQVASPKQVHLETNNHMLSLTSRENLELPGNQMSVFLVGAGNQGIWKKTQMCTERICKHTQMRWCTILNEKRQPRPLFHYAA